MIAHTTILFAGEELLLNPMRSLYWPGKEMLVLSDIHLGKAAHFRKHGIAVPGEVMQKDLDRLARLMEWYQPKTVMVVGDLFHSGYNSEIKTFTQWLMPQVKWILVRGNHDKITVPANPSFDPTLTDKLTIGPITFVHQPQPISTPSICGHIHPGVTLKFHSHQNIKLPCFLVSQNQIILPAFSLFTGLDTEFAKGSDQKFSCYVIVENEVVILRV